MPFTIREQSRIYRIASIPGDGIGVDITNAAEQVLHKLSSASGSTFEFGFHTFDWSSRKYLERGWYMPPDGIQQLKRFDAIYFGAVGWPGRSSLNLVDFLEGDK
jgi:isocitrate/isopropylmalate dehydrogenase